MRILHVVNRMGMGGIETFIMNIYRSCDDNVTFDFAVHSKKLGEYDNEILTKGGKIYRFNSRRDNFIKYWSEWRSFLKNNSKKYDAIHMHVSSLTTIVPLIYAKKYGIKVRIIHAHSTSQNGIIHKIFCFINKKRIKKYANFLLSCSHKAGNFVFGNNKYEIVYNGINISKYKFNFEIRNSVRKKLKLDDRTLALVHVGRFTYAKNHDFLIDIFKEIHKKNINAKLFLIGIGELEKDIRDKVNNFKLSGYVVFLGVRNDICTLLQGMDFFVFPSNYEGLPIATIEAQASGLPVIASDCVTKEISITKLVQFLSLNESPKKWAQTILDHRFDRTKDAKQILNNDDYDIIRTKDKILEIYNYKKEANKCDQGKYYESN